MRRRFMSRAVKRPQSAAEPVCILPPHRAIGVHADMADASLDERRCQRVGINLADYERGVTVDYSPTREGHRVLRGIGM